MSKLQIIADKTAISLSLVCAVHCLALPIFLLLVPTLASLPLGDEDFHRWLLFAVIPISTAALFMGCRRHKRKSLAVLGTLGLIVLTVSALLGHDLLGELLEKSLTLAGATLIALGHLWNYRLCQSLEACVCSDGDSDVDPDIS